MNNESPRNDETTSTPESDQALLVQLQAAYHQRKQHHVTALLRTAPAHVRTAFLKSTVLPSVYQVRDILFPPFKER
jgi:hypothetical protein